MKKLYPVFTALTASLCAQAAILTTVGSTDMRETKVWVKFDSAPKSPTAKIFETKSPEKKSDGKFVRIGGDYNPEIYTAVFEDLAPNTEYAFEIADGEKNETINFALWTDLHARAILWMPAAGAAGIPDSPPLRPQPPLTGRGVRLEYAV